MTGKRFWTGRPVAGMGVALGIWALLSFAPIAVEAQTPVISPAAAADKGTLAVKTNLRFPEDVAVDAGGNVYFVEYALYSDDAKHFDADVIRKVDATTGMMTVVAEGSPQQGESLPAGAVEIHYPRTLLFDAAGNMLVADSGGGIYKVDAHTGVLTQLVGQGKRRTLPHTGQPIPAAELADFQCNGIALDKAGHLYMVDRGGFVLKYDEKTGNVTVVAGNGKRGYSGDGGPAIDALLNLPDGIAIDGQGNIYVADHNNSAVRRIDAATGVITTVAGCGYTTRSGITDLSMVADGVAVKATDVFIGFPTGVTLDPQGNLLICGSRANRVCRVDVKTGMLTAIAGAQWQTPYEKDKYAGDGGPALKANLCEPFGIACDARGNLYIAEYGNFVVRKIAAKTGIITTVAGTGKLKR